MRNAMIYIGYGNREKVELIKLAVEQTSSGKGIKKIIVFSPPQYALNAETIKCATGLATVEYTYTDIIKYKVFYPLLEEIDDTRLLVINECMRTQNRYDLTYNCLNHYLNQTANRVIFEYFPFIENATDFMILLDRESPGRYKGRGFEFNLLNEIDLYVKPQHYELSKVSITLPEKAYDEYKAERDKLFDALGNGDPDNIPRRLHVWTGRYKRAYIDANPDNMFVARNARFNRANVIPYSKAERGIDYGIIDFPHRQIDFNDYLKSTMATNLSFVSTGLAVDNVYYDAQAAWLARLEEFYAKASLCV